MKNAKQGVLPVPAEDMIGKGFCNRKLNAQFWAR